MNPKRSFELLQAYRGVAALMVLLYHASPLFREALKLDSLAIFGVFGYAGVDIFFVLSGFIICHVHRADIARPERVKEFLIKRMIRVFPAYWIVNLLIIPIYFIAPTFGEERYRDLGAIIQSLLLLPQREYPILTVGWSLTHELLFYALFALLILLPLNITRLLAACWFGASLLASTFAGGQAQENYLLFGFLLSKYNLEFALGCLCAYLIRLSRPGYGLLLAVLGAAGLLTACIVDVATSGGGESYRVIAYGLPAAMLVLGSVWLEQERRVGVPQALKFLGDASYSLYLLHLPLLSLTVKLVQELRVGDWVGAHGAMILCLILTLVGGLVFHVRVERPMLKALNQLIRKDGAHLPFAPLIK